MIFNVFAAHTDLPDYAYMIFSIAGLYLFCIIYAVVYRCFTKEEYHESKKMAVGHIVLSSISILLHLYDFGSDTLLCYHYYTIDNIGAFALVLIFIIAPVIFTAVIMLGGWYPKSCLNMNDTSTPIKQRRMCILLFLLTLPMIAPAVFFPLMV